MISVEYIHSHGYSLSNNHRRLRYPNIHTLRPVRTSLAQAVCVNKTKTLFKKPVYTIYAYYLWHFSHITRDHQPPRVIASYSRIHSYIKMGTFHVQVTCAADAIILGRPSLQVRLFCFGSCSGSLTCGAISAKEPLPTHFIL